jgi:membrane protease YdiL (CAAX protease family)
VIRSRIVIAIAVGAIFGALHLNARGWLTLPYFMLLSLFYSLVSLRDEGLEIAIGGHAGLNLFAYAAANSGVMAPAAIGAATGDGASGAMPLNAAAILVLSVDGALFYGLTRLSVRLFCRPR